MNIINIDCLSGNRLWRTIYCKVCWACHKWRNHPPNNSHVFAILLAPVSNGNTGAAYCHIHREPTGSGGILLQNCTHWPVALPDAVIAHHVEDAHADGVDTLCQYMDQYICAAGWGELALQA